MEAPPKGTLKAATAVIDRLLQMRQLWEDAAANYFDPSRFILALQNCITTSRTVTFILQSNKADIPNFDIWYQGHVARWAADPLMKWAKEARNSIEKRGDLEGRSEIRCEIIAGFLPGPETTWMPQDLFNSPHDIWRSVPRKFFIPHVIENGTLLIERRWVDNNLPQTEVLEALAHVYDEFCAAVIDLLKINSLPVPPRLDKTRPDPMGELAMDRAIYLAMRDGSAIGMRYFKKPITAPRERDRKQLIKRYGKGVSWSRLEAATTLREVADAYFENARVVMSRDGQHPNITFLLKDNIPIEVVKTEHPDRAARYVLMRELAKLARIIDANAVILICEVWTAFGNDIPKSGFASEAAKRGEALMLDAASATGESFVMMSKVTRRPFGSKKVRSLDAPEVEIDGFPFLFAPFFKQWGCMDEEALRRAFDQMDRMGIETPRIK